ncbi:MAG: hypothetical protein ABJ327_08995 [Litoreibacter sp.]
MSFVDHVGDFVPARVVAAELDDLKVCMGRVIFFMKRWSLDWQENAQQSPRGVLNYGIEIFHLQDVDQPTPVMHHQQAIHVE